LIEVIFAMMSMSMMTGFVWFGKQVKRILVEQKAAKEGSKALLHDRIVQAHGYFMEKGTWSLHSMKSTIAMYEQYKILGGNGAIDSAMDELRKLPILNKIGDRA